MRRHVDDSELLLSLENELPSSRLSHVSRHVATCTECRERANRFRTTLQEIQALHQGAYETPDSRSGYRRVRLESVLREAAAAPSPSWFDALVQRPDNSLWRGAGIAVIVAVCTVAVLAMRGSDTPRVAIGLLPESAVTPGAISTLTAAELCNGTRPSRLVTEDVRAQVLQAYGMETAPADSYELDALITPELGGSTDRANLWPQRYDSPVWNARVKDELERLLPQMVCNRQITLAEAQHEIATDWIASYQRHFKTATPLRAHRGPAKDDEPELVIVRREPARAVIARVHLMNR